MRTITFNYTGKTYKNCDPSSAQQGALSDSQNWRKTIASSYEKVFGMGSQMYQTLSGGLDKIIAKGREAMGFSPEELAAKRSESINAAATAAKKVNAAIGGRAAMTGAVPGVESGVTQATRSAANTQILGQEADREANITEQGYATQREAFDKAVSAKEGSLSASFAPSTAVGGEVAAAGDAEAAQANANEAASTSWMGMVGGVADAAAGGLTAGLACVTLDTPIMLSSNLYVRAEVLSVGDILMGFGGPETIVKLETSMQPCVRLTAFDGTELVVSESHTLLRSNRGYVFAKDALGSVLSTKNSYTLMIKSVEPVGVMPVVKIYLSDSHGYISNNIWSLE